MWFDEFVARTIERNPVPVVEEVSRPVRVAVRLEPEDGTLLLESEPGDRAGPAAPPGLGGCVIGTHRCAGDKLEATGSFKLGAGTIEPAA